MRTGELTAVSAVLATGMLTMGAGVTAAATRVDEGICSAPAAHKALAAQLSVGIQRALRGRSGNHAVSVYDSVTAVSCQANDDRHFSSASIVKALILAALLRWHQEAGTPLSSWERGEATLMITQSDNDAATDLWNEVGVQPAAALPHPGRHGRDRPGTGGYWGLTQVTAHDEMLLLTPLRA